MSDNIDRSFGPDLAEATRTGEPVHVVRAMRLAGLTLAEARDEHARGVQRVGVTPLSCPDCGKGNSR